MINDETSCEYVFPISYSYQKYCIDQYTSTINCNFSSTRILNHGSTCNRGNKLPIFESEQVDILFGWWYSSGAGPDGANPDNMYYQLRDRPAYDILVSYNGGEKVKYRNEGPDTLTVYKRRIVVTETPITIPAGGTVEITLEPDELLVQK